MLLQIIAQRNYFQKLNKRFHGIYTNDPVMFNVEYPPIRSILKEHIDFPGMEGTELWTSNGSRILICSDTILFKSVVDVIIDGFDVDLVWNTMVESYADSLAGLPLKTMRDKENLKMIMSTFLL